MVDQARQSTARGGYSGAIHADTRTSSDTTGRRCATDRTPASATTRASCSANAAGCAGCGSATRLRCHQAGRGYPAPNRYAVRVTGHPVALRSRHSGGAGARRPGARRPGAAPGHGRGARRKAAGRGAEAPRASSAQEGRRATATGRSVFSASCTFVSRRTIASRSAGKTAGGRHMREKIRGRSRSARKVRMAPVPQPGACARGVVQAPLRQQMKRPAPRRKIQAACIIA